MKRDGHAHPETFACRYPLIATAGTRSPVSYRTPSARLASRRIVDGAPDALRELEA